MSRAETPPEQLDVLVVGAGISGIGAGRYLRTEHPAKSFAVLEARGASGGTWDLFRYPGVRSDSDLHTFGYDFKPWRDRQAIADAPRILAYLREVVAENGLDAHIRYHHRVTALSWSSGEARWLADVERTDTGERLRLSARWVFCAGGYYRYDRGHTPRFEGRENFRGTVVHPQQWPEDLDHAGRRVVVIGSGATAVTLVPALAETASHVTMLQRTPTYVMPVPREDAVAAALRKWFGEERGHALARRKNIAQQRAVWSFAQRFPKTARKLIRWVNTRQLPKGYPVDEHFNPPYDPWDQRLCAVPDGDLFKAIGRGAAEVVTDRIVRFTGRGVLLESGRELEADIVVTATGLTVQALGGIALTVDGEPVQLSRTVAYKGMMLSGVPNLVMAIGYTNSSWTLKIGLLCEHFCRLLSHLDAHGYDAACPEPGDPDMPTRPFLDFAAGYILRAVDQLPRQGDRMPWLTSMSYHSDVKLLRSDDVADPELRLFRATGAGEGAAPDGAAAPPGEDAEPLTGPVAGRRED
ncbi:flavin-containing monooxygenase [Streptomyces fragilis]|uniref:NAD(P)/FAD-dependent oxidoreductase n=1 Tax=Streptomyces fragilis TaxID=67301 RepID=A0ABV2YF22_9ACTN|nr:NAD(P)/FAD-dependent oxidoreductase [Streptomyces fragilis]